MLKAVGEFLDSLFHVIWELLKFTVLIFFFLLVATGTFFKWILIILYYVFIYPPLWVLRKTYWFFRDARAGRRKRRAVREAEIYGED